MYNSSTHVRQVTPLKIITLLLFAMAANVIFAPDANAGLSNGTQCPSWLDQLAPHIEALASRSGSPPDQIAAFLAGFISSQGSEYISTQIAAQRAFSQSSENILTSQNVEIAAFESRWFSRQPGQPGSETALAVNDVMHLPDWRDENLKRTFDSLINDLGLGQYPHDHGQPYFFFADVNGLKLTNSAAPTLSYPGLHGTGDAVLGMIGKTVQRLNSRGIVARSTGADELLGILFFEDDVEAMHFITTLNLAVESKTETYVTEQIEHFRSLYRATAAAREWSELSPELRPNLQLRFGEVQAQALDKIRKHLFKLSKDRPSLSTSVAKIGTALLQEAQSIKKTPLQLAIEATDSQVENIKIQYKLANGLQPGRDSGIDLSYEDRERQRPLVRQPITFGRGH